MSGARNTKVLTVLGLLTFLGSLAGLISALSRFSNYSGNILTEFLALIGCVYFVTGIILGAILINRRSRFRYEHVIFWCAQIPVLESSYFSFHVVTGFLMAIWLRLDVADAGYGLGFVSQLEISIMTGGPMVVGVNIAPIVVVYLLLRWSKNEKTIGNENIQ